MAFIDVLKYRGPENALVWKATPPEKKWGVRHEELRLGTQLVVGPSQIAVFVKGGQIADIFAPGTYTLSTKNLPILGKIIGLPFGGQSPFKAEVFYINKSVVMDIPFALKPFNMLDPNFRVPIPVTVCGSFAVRAGEARLFLTKLLGNLSILEPEQIKQYFQGVITENVKSSVTRIAREWKMSPMELEATVSEVSAAVKPIAVETMEKYGLHLELFNIEGISIIDDDPRVRKLVDDYQRLMSQDMEERLRLKRRAENIEVYRVERTFDTTERVAESIGNAGTGADGSLLGTIVGLGVAQPLAGSVAGVVNHTLNRQPEEPVPPKSPGKADVFSTLKELNELRNAGILTEEEFTAKKAELLSKI